MIPRQGIDFPYIQEALRRRFWYMVVPFFLISIGVVLYCIFAPRVYRAETVILVEPQKIPGEYVSSTVTIDLRSRLRTITQQIKSRTRLEKIINDYDLYPDIRASATMTDAIETFRRDIEVNVRGGRHAFEVSYQGKDPVKVRDVTNTIANLFIEDNLKLREAQAAGTTLFLERELKRLQEILHKKETAIREFKEKYRGLLPENMDQNYRMMAHLQRQLGSINTTIQQTKDRKILLDTQLNNLRRLEAEATGSATLGEELFGTGPGGGTPVEHGESPDLQSLRNELRKLRARYSDKHPDVRKLQAMISKLEQQEASSSHGGNGETSSIESGDTSLFADQIADLAAQVAATDRELEKLRDQKAKIEKELEMYRVRVERGPKVEQMLVDLKRGYDEIQESYRSLLDKKFRAKLAENLELSQQGEQFTILDHAQLPDKPYKPQTRRLLLIGFLLALSGGIGLGICVEYLDRTFLSTRDVEANLGIQVLASIPYIATDKDRRQILVKRALSVGVLIGMVSVLLYALYFLWKMDPMAMSLSMS